MPEEAPKPFPDPKFPIQPSKEQVQQLTAALLMDSLSIMGLGVPSEKVDSGKLQSWLWDFHHHFDKAFIRTHGAGAHLEYMRKLGQLPSIGPSAELGAASLLAIRTRIYAILGIASDGDPEDAAGVLWGVYRQAVFAHHLLRSSHDLQTGLQSVRMMIDLLGRHSRQRFPIGWNHGVTNEDIQSVIVSRLLTADAAFEDIRQWIRILQAKSLGPDRHSAELDVAAARSAVLQLVHRRAEARHTEIQRAMNEIHALIEMEHELVEDSLIDPFCHNFRIGANERISLGKRGYVELGSALGTDAARQPMTHESRLELENFVDDFLADPESTTRETEQTTGAAMRRIRDIDTNFQPITPSRAFIVWRGAPGSAAEARRVMPRLLRSTVRTAWFATCGNENILRYFADNRYQEFGVDQSFEPQERGPAIQSRETDLALARPIAIHPEEFPVKDWMSFVFGQAIPGTAPAGSALSFGINAVRMLNSADEVLRVDAAQSFACSMSAVEACIGGKGGDLMERVSRRAARLLVPAPSLRADAIDLFKKLYDSRSRFVHGGDCEISHRQAVFMRYLASCVAYALAGFAKAAPRFELPSSEDGIRKYLDSDVFSEGALIGTVTPEFLIDVLGSKQLQSCWVDLK